MRVKVETLTLHMWAAIPVLLILNISVFCLLLVIASEELRVQYIPDDAFYYLSLARNFASLGLWTFDSGVSITSGFHLLFAYLLTGLYALLQPDATSFVVYGLILSSLWAIGALIVFWFWALKRKNVLFLMFLALAFSSQNFVYNAMSVTEWSLTVLIAALYWIWWLAKHKQEPLRLSDALVLFVLGFLGSVVRSDFGLMPLAILLSICILRLLGVVKQLTLLPLMGFTGALTGLLVIFSHNYFFTNEFLQSSARMKAYWAQGSISSYYAAPILVGDIIGLMGLSLLAILLATAVLPKFLGRTESDHDPVSRNGRFVLQRHNSLRAEQSLSGTARNDLTLLLCVGSICITGYTWLYAHNAGVQPWYSANLIVPVLMVVFVISDYVSTSISIRQIYVLPVLSILILSALIVNLTKLYPVSSVKAPWPHQKIMLQAGQHLKNNPLDAKVGAWNAGIIGYFEGGHVVNLDGLVNNDIYIYIINSDLSAYLTSREIHYIIDFENMIAIESLRARGGYNHPQFLNSLRPQLVFDQRDYGWKHMTLYYIERNEP
jgi:hypothetical protein